jgi:hypothetical protein
MLVRAHKAICRSFFTCCCFFMIKCYKIHKMFTALLRKCVTMRYQEKLSVKGGAIHVCQSAKGLFQEEYARL